MFILCRLFCCIVLCCLCLFRVDCCCFFSVYVVFRCVGLDLLIVCCAVFFCVVFCYVLCCSVVSLCCVLLCLTGTFHWMLCHCVVLSTFPFW